MVGELAGLPLLISAPCPHCEQMSTRGSNAAVAPMWPQFGQTIRVSMSDSYRRSWRDTARLRAQRNLCVPNCNLTERKTEKEKPHTQNRAWRRFRIWGQT
jgi:hypothetical protein